MGRISELFETCRKPAFIGFTVAGDPNLETSLRAARALIDGGTDILELGIPFSDPVADGPTIQKADERSLASGSTVAGIFDMVRELRETTQTPIVLLTYYNTVYHRGIERFYREARNAGVDGILIADMPFEESDEVVQTALRYAVDPIFLITQTTSEERIKKIASRSQGYLYLVSVLGVTGTRERISAGAIDLLHRVRTHTDLPLALGFGISTPSHARTCSEAGADGVIVGSAIVEIVEKNLDNPDRMVADLKEYVAAMKRAF